VQERVDVRVCGAFNALRQQPLEVELVSTMRDCTAIPSASDYSILTSVSNRMAEKVARFVGTANLQPIIPYEQSRDPSKFSARDNRVRSLVYVHTWEAKRGEARGARHTHVG
jgi:hypothetical protein